MKQSLTLFLSFLLTAVFSIAMAQKTTVTGTVTDAADGSPLPGVSVSVKGTTTGTITGVDGKYTLSVDPGAVLVFSFVGFTTQEIPANSGTVNVSLAEDIAALNEIVVVGYGEQEKKDVTGAMSTINAEDFNAGVINSPEQLFQGKLSGVQVTQNGGEPGGGISINIRGANSIRSGNNPLYVVDGFPLDGRDVSSSGIDFGLGNQTARNPLNFINPNDIASIDVLKDASATAIYGSRGANGVILITTKRAEAGEQQINFSSYVGVTNLPKKIDLLPASSYVDAAVSAGATQNNVDFGYATDWQDEIFQNAITHSHAMSVARGTENGSYRLSMSYLNQEGIVETSNMERITARVNVNQKLIQDRLTVDFQLTIGHTNDNFVPTTSDAGFEGNLIGAMLAANPTLPVRRDDGTLVQRSETLTRPNGSTIGVASDFRNPVAMIELIDDQAKTTRILGNVGLTLKIVDGLNFRTQFGIDNSNSVRRIDYDPEYSVAGTADNGAAGIFDIILSSYIIENFMTYKKDIGNGSINALLGYSYQEFVSRGHGVFVFNTAVTGNDPLGTSNIGVGEDINGRQQFSADQTNKLQSFYGRVNYSLMDKYLITASLRADGSSRFGANNRYGLFPSLALAWRISEEDFAPDFFSDLKLRFGWGITGNQEFANGVSQPTSTVDASGGLARNTADNPDIKWEETTQWNIGVDFALANGRVFGTLDFFNKTTTDLLAQFEVPAPFPFPIAFQNLDADLINTGLEFSLGSTILPGNGKDEFKLNVDANFTYLFKNEIEGLGSSFFNSGTISGQGLSGAFSQRIAEGQPLGAWYMLEFAGFNDDGLSTYANNNNLVFVGSAQPDYFYGFTITANYQNFDLSMNFNGRGGVDVYNNTANALFVKGALANGRNVTVDAANSPESTLNAPDVSTRFLENGAFLRFNNFTLGYNVNTDNIEWLSNLRFYVSGQNIFVISDYSGFDPEVNVNRAINGVPSFGIDYTGFPRGRTFIIGTNISF